MNSLKFSHRMFRKKKSAESRSKKNERAKLSSYKKYIPDAAVLLGCALILTLFFPRGKSFQFSDLKEGRVYVGPEIIAPFTFPVNKTPEEYEADVKRIRDAVAPVFQRNTDVEKTQKQKLESFLDHLAELLKKPETAAQDLHLLFRDEGIIVSDEDINALLYGFEKTDAAPETVNKAELSRRMSVFKNISSVITASIDEFYSTGILDVNKGDLATTATKITVLQGEQEPSSSMDINVSVPFMEDINYYFDRKEAFNMLLEKLRTNSGLDERKVKIAYQISAHFLAPNIIYDKQETDAMINAAVANVPLAKDQVLAGERIIDSHERLTSAHIEKLNSLAQAKAEMGESSGLWSRFTPGMGKFFIVLFILSILVMLMWRHHRAVLDNRRKSTLIMIVIVFLALLTFLINSFSLSPYLIPIPIAAIIVTIFFDAQLGFLVAITISLLVGSMRGDDFVITFISIFVSTIAVLSVSKVRTRNWVLRAFAYIAGAYIVAIMMYDFVNYIPFRSIIQDLGFGVINAFLSPIFAYGLIIVFEFVFDITTDMTLLELSDLNQPLLRQLAIQAPGTYHHSILVGTLAEAATEAIGGNALLARVGAYYHDIGKIEKPEYFVENQTKGRNPQEKLTPSMSSLILSNHVKRGVDMARQYNLPKEVVEFIYEHHGTSLMSYFYQKALEQNAEEKVSKDDFRYPGPKPQSRETAIMMCADVVEAASRTLKEPTPSRIKGLVEQIIDEKFKSGELDESPLTLKDLSKISDAFQKILIGIHHARVEYPSDKKEKETTEKQEEKVNK